MRFIYLFTSLLAMFSPVFSELHDARLVDSRNRVKCFGVFVADNWVLTTTKCPETEKILAVGDKGYSAVIGVQEQGDFRLMQTNYTESPPVAVLADQQFPYEGIGQKVYYEFYRRRKRRTRGWSLRACAEDRLCTGLPKRKDKCFKRRGSPLYTRNHVKSVISGLTVTGGCITKKFEILVVPVRSAIPWIEEVTGETTPDAPQLCN